MCAYEMTHSDVSGQATKQHWVSFLKINRHSFTVRSLQGQHHVLFTQRTCTVDILHKHHHVHTAQNQSFLSVSGRKIHPAEDAIKIPQRKALVLDSGQI